MLQVSYSLYKMNYAAKSWKEMVVHWLNIPEIDTCIVNNEGALLNHIVYEGKVV